MSVMPSEFSSTGIQTNSWSCLGIGGTGFKTITPVEIAQKLGVSRSLVSGVVAELVDRGLLRPETNVTPTRQ